MSNACDNILSAIHSGVLYKISNFPMECHAEMSLFFPRFLKIKQKNAKQCDFVLSLSQTFTKCVCVTQYIALDVVGSTAIIDVISYSL